MTVLKRYRNQYKKQTSYSLTHFPPLLLVDQATLLTSSLSVLFFQKNVTSLSYGHCRIFFLYFFSFFIFFFFFHWIHVFPPCPHTLTVTRMDNVHFISSSTAFVHKMFGIWKLDFSITDILSVDTGK